MPGTTSQAELQRRLAEMDARLRSMQEELEQDLPAVERSAEPDPSVAVRGSVPARELRQRASRIFPPQPPAPPQSAPDPRLEAMCTRLLRSMQELLAGYEIALGHVAGGTGSHAAAVTVAAGPFSRVEMVAEFERALAGLPQVAEVALRGYEGTDRAILEVQLRG